MKLYEFGPKDVFYMGGNEVPPGFLDPGDIVKVNRIEGEFKVTAIIKRPRKPVLIEAEKMSSNPLFRVRYRREVFNVEAVCSKGTDPMGEFLIRYRGRPRWINKADTVSA